VIEPTGLSMEAEHGMTLMVSMIAVIMIAAILIDLTYYVDSVQEKLLRIRMSRS